MTKKQMLDVVVSKYFEALDEWWMFEKRSATDENAAVLARYAYESATTVESILKAFDPTKDWYYCWVERDMLA